jgi:hypothetical protein
MSWMLVRVTVPSALARTSCQSCHVAPMLPSIPCSEDMIGCSYLEEDTLHDVLLHVMRTTSRESSWTCDSSGASAEHQPRPASGSEPRGSGSLQGSSGDLMVRVRAASPPPVGLQLDEVGPCVGGARDLPTK